MDLKTLAARRAEAKLEYAGETLSLAYYPDRYTNVVHQRLLAFESGGGRQTDELARMLADLLAEWDLTDDGQPVPIDTESISKTPLKLQGEILDVIVSGMMVTRKNGRTSPTGSRAGS